MSEVSRENVSLFTAVLICCCLSTALASTPAPKKFRNPFDSYVGTVCRPPFGFRPKSCGAYEVLTEEVTRAPDYVYGPNTCRFLRMVRVNELDYKYSKYCDWAYSHSYYIWVQQCQLICQPTRECSNRNQTIEVSTVSCCPGFQVMKQKKSTHYNYYYNQHFRIIDTTPAGCPTAKGETLLECLRLHNLTRFISFLEESSFLGLANRSDVTVLAPTNEAFALVEARLVSIDPDTLVGNHIINQTLKESKFIHRKRFTSLAGLTLHSTLVSFPDFRLITYQPNAYNAINPVQHREVMFINGAQIENGDACNTQNGTLHIIDRVLMPGEETIADILRGNSDFSMFVEALEFAGTISFLEENDTSHTVFAPTNEAFSRVIPPELLNCLTNYKRLPLSNLVLYHISTQTDYSSVLSLRQNAFSLLLQHSRPQIQPVVTADNGTLFLGELGSQIPVIMADIPASNGVIHVIDGVLVPPNIDFGPCQRFVPTTPTPLPPTTVPSTTSMTTDSMNATNSAPTLPVTNLNPAKEPNSADDNNNP